MTTQDNEILHAVANFLMPDNAVALMVFHFLTDFTSAQDDNDVCAAIEDYVEDMLTSLLTHIASAITMQLDYVHEMVWNGTKGLWEVNRLVGTVEPASTFTGPSEQLPWQNAAVLTANTARPKTRGRKFIPGMTEGGTAGDSEWTSTVLTNLATALANYLADETISAGNDLIVGVPSTVDGNFYPFTDGEVNEIVGSQRRRKPGVGI